MGLASCLEFPRPQVDRCPLRDRGLLGGIRTASFKGPPAGGGDKLAQQAHNALGRPLVPALRLYNRTGGQVGKITPGTEPNPQAQLSFYHQEMMAGGTELRNMYNMAGKPDLWPKLGPAAHPEAHSRAA